MQRLYCSCVNVTVTTTEATETTTRKSHLKTYRFHSYPVYFIVASCGSYDVYCVNDTTYQTCSTFLIWTTYTFYTCDDGTYCDETSDT